MKNKFYIFIITFLAFQFSNAQSNYYYYYKGSKVYLELDKSKVNIITNQNFSKFETSNIGLKNYNLEQDQVVSLNRIAETEFLEEPTTIEFFQKINSLKSISNIRSVGFYFKRNDTLSIGTSNYFYVKLKSTNDLNVLENFCLQKSVEVVKQVPYMPEWYILSTTNPQFSSLELSNQFYESRLFADIDPAFMFNFRNSCTNDTNFGSLWGLNNTANPSIDINACQAWNITEGDNIKVAIIDGGINKNHPDLFANISPLSFNGDNGTSPSVGNDAHGTHIAGTIAAMKDNNLHIVGVAPKSKLMSISFSSSNVSTITSSILASSLEWAWQNGAEVINCSWGDQGGFFYNQLQSSLLENAISNALNQGRQGKGCIVVFASGNYGTSNNSLDYPGNTFDQILTVGAINSSGNRPSFSAYGNKLDVIAPGVGILSLSPNNSIVSNLGTSFAAPHVAGIAALILSVNNCLTGLQVNTIIEQTCQKINPFSYLYISTPGRANGTWNNQLGYGLVDAHAAVLVAQSMGDTTLDLMVRDGEDEYGDEPNNTTQYLWASNDIWVRNNDDDGMEHQNPEYHPTNPNYAYVRVTNKSCVASTGNEILKFYWAKAGSSLSWPESWDGNHYFSQGPLLGAPVGQGVPIPALQGGQETIIKIPFPIPNPGNYNWFQGWEQWHFCLLARIEAINDPLTETNDLVLNVKNNNGIAWKNVTIVDVEENVTTGTIAVGNPSDTPKTFFLEFIVEDIETGKPIFEEAEVGIKMDDILFNAWERGGKEAQLLDPTLDEKRKIVRGNHVILDNIAFNANEVGSLTLDFNFLIAEITDKPKFKYHLVQRDAVTGAIVGGETYEIKKKTRNLFQATAPDKEVDLNQTITISAEDINEPATYNWYDLAGNLIFQGKDLQIANAVAEKYKLEVIATTDGYKNYKEVEVTLKPSTLETITPNPATNNVAINYKLNQAGSAYLMIIGYYGSNGTSNNYILDVNSNAISLNINNYPSGFYTVALVVNGEIVDAKTLIKQ